MGNSCARKTKKENPIEITGLIIYKNMITRFSYSLFQILNTLCGEYDNLINIFKVVIENAIPYYKYETFSK